MKSIWYLLRQFQPYKKTLILSIFFQLLTALFTLFSIPLIIPFFQILFDASPSSYQMPDSLLHIEDTLTYGFSRLIAISDKRNALAVMCMSVMVIILLRNVFRYLASFYLIPARNGVLRDLRQAFFESIKSMTLQDRIQYKKGQILSTLSNDFNEIDHGLMKAIELVVKNPLIIIGCLLFMMLISVKLSLIAIVLAILAFTIIAQGGSFLKKDSPRLHHSLGEINSKADEYLSAKKLIESYNAQDFFSAKTNTLIDEHHNMSVRMLRLRDLASPLSEILLVGVIVVLLWFASHMVFQNQLRPETFFAFIFAFYNIIDPAKSFSREYYNVQRSSASLARVRTFIDKHVESQKVQSGTLPFSFESAIKFDKVVFSYDDDKVLADLSFVIPRSKKVGLVGLSGSGKTTIIDLLLRFYEPTGGSITIDDQNASEFDVTSYRAHFALVTQESLLFNLSLAENVTLRDDYKEEDVTKALIKARIGENQPILNDQVADAGQNLSGGERQRVSIARALYSNADILIFDEPSNNLDASTSDEIVSTILEHGKDKTIIVISHDLKLLENLDEILVLSNGTIVQKGSFSELKQQNGVFTELLRC